MTNKIPIEDILYETPQVPQAKEILFNNFPKKEQYWRRTVFPLDWKALSEEDQVDFILTDLKRREYGIWFYNNGEKTYLTGNHYFFLNWCNIGCDTPDGYPEYRDADRLDFYFEDYCAKDKDCYGMIFVTCRRSGKTQKALACLYNQTTLKEEAHSGLQSITNKDAKDNLFVNGIIRIWRKIPFEIRDVHSGEDEPKTSLRFFSPSTRSTKGLKRKRAKALESWIDFQESKPSGYQGNELYRILLDEPASCKVMNLHDWWATTSKTLIKGSKIMGKAYLFTTLEDMSPKSGVPFFEVFVDSDIKEKDKNGRTKSGLYRHFRPSYFGLEGFVDKYGNDKKNEDGEYLSKIHLQNERDGASPSKLIQLKRQFPFTIEECFDLVGGDAWEEDVKEILKHAWREHQNKPAAIKKVVLYEIGGEVNYSPNSKSEQAVTILEDELPDVDYKIGVDSMGSDNETGGVGGSKFGVAVMKGYGGMTGESYIPVACFSFRPDKLEEAYQVLLLLSKKYGKYGRLKVLGETNQGGGSAVVAYFSNRNAIKLLMKRPKTLGIDYNDKGDKYWIYRSDDVKKMQIILGNRYLRRYGMNIKIPELLQSLNDFGKKNADLADAFLMALLAMGDFDKEAQRKNNVAPRTKWIREIKRNSIGARYEEWREVPI